MADIQKDLVLAPNEYAYVLDETKGNVSCNVGPHKMSLSQSDRLVVFDNNRKKFRPCDRYDSAIQLFVTAPEGWYIALKNPAPENRHPAAGTSNTIPERMQIGCKVNIPGPASFALYPGQMAQVIKGHTLRSNQYLVARVYDADALNGKDNGSERSEKSPWYVNGQILIIKGTEISFYIPPTGIEVKAIENNPSSGYARDAVTLERLEYCLLKDEDGNKRYVHGPAVVFPKPTESFVQDGSGNIKRNAIELSDISGVYVKVIADYKDEKGKAHKAGDELFITGKDQMIYYPRPEHTFITYNGRVMHHAIAIPKGEGRYIMNRMTGEIKTVQGPAMYLPDPRVEVAVKRTLTRSQCNLWYPGNKEVLAANGYSETVTKEALANSLNDIVGTFADSTMYVASANALQGTPIKKEINKINRTNTYTPPRTITLNSGKYEGAVALDVWTGYAVNVISKDGTRKVVKGPQTILLDYDQTLEVLELSTGKPKTTDNLERAVYLRYENNRIGDIVNVETEDFVNASVKVSYRVNFDEAMIDKWFSVDNYVKHLCDWARSVIKNAAKKCTINEFHENYHDIILNAIKDEGATGYLHAFTENGMVINDVEILSLDIESKIQKMIDSHQQSIIARALDLAAARAAEETEKEIIAISKEKIRLSEEYAQMQAQLKAETESLKMELEAEKCAAQDAEDKRKADALIEIQTIKDKADEMRRENVRKNNELEAEKTKRMDALKIERERARAESMKIILEAIGPDLAAAMNAQNNQAIVQAIAEAISPYAIANGMPVADAINTVMRGTSLEKVVKPFIKED